MIKVKNAMETKVSDKVTYITCQGRQNHKPDSAYSYTLSM